MENAVLNTEYILEVRDLVKVFEMKKQLLSKQKNSVVAVNHSSLKLKKGEIFGLVGESGCGKSTMGRCILQLIEPTKGSVYFNGKELLGLPPRSELTLKWKL